MVDKTNSDLVKQEPTKEVERIKELQTPLSLTGDKGVDEMIKTYNKGYNDGLKRLHEKSGFKKEIRFQSPIRRLVENRYK